MILIRREDAAEEIKKKRAPVGFCQGVALGASDAKPPFIKKNFWIWKPTPDEYVIYPPGSKIDQNYYNAGLALGHSYGRELLPGGLDKFFFKENQDHQDEYKPAPCMLAGNIDKWSDTDWRDYYTYLGGAFYQLHIK